MKRILPFFLVTFPSLAQSAQAGPMAMACGDATSNYAFSEGSSHGIETTYPEKATIVLVSKSYTVHYGCGPTVRLGMDSKWIGAVCLDQHMVTQIAPGDHHLCVDLQTQKGAPAYTALHSLHAEAGKIYYFQAYYGIEHSITLQPIDSDEGSLLLQTTKSATSKLKR